MKKSKQKIKTEGKSYSVQESPFYKLGTKRRLLELFHIQDLPSFKKLIVDSENYKVFTQKSPSGKERLIQQPIGSLDTLHTKVASFLCRIKVLDNLHSGTKGRSHVTNAMAHLGDKKVLTTDIKNFFQSTTQGLIFNCFCYQFKMSPDVARLLTMVCCYNSHLPTGSRLSMPLAYWANCNMFNELSDLSRKHNVIMTIYVDDLTFSGNEVNKLFLNTVNKIVKRHGHKLHPSKTKLFSKQSSKQITGVIVKSESAYVKNSQHRNIYEDMMQWNIVKNDPCKPFSLEARLVGRLYAASQIEPKFKDKAKSVTNYRPIEGRLSK